MPQYIHTQASTMIERAFSDLYAVRTALRFPRKRVRHQCFRHQCSVRCLSGAPPPAMTPVQSQTVDTGKSSGKLGKIIKDSIKATGPVPVSRYMQLCLGHPVDGYYTRERQAGDVFGQKGDFITSPEISQMFGELIAVWFITQWVAQGQAKKVRLIELGPGRGTLMDDILRTFLAIPTFPISALKEIELVEVSEPMRAQQKSKLEQRIKTFGGHADYVKLHWSDRIADVPAAKDTFTCVIAHEFFDALPINVFQNTHEGFREVYVNLASEPETSDHADSPGPTSLAPIPDLTLALSREPTTLSRILPSTSPRFQEMKDGDRVEISSESWEMMRVIGELISGSRGDLKTLDAERGGEIAPEDQSANPGKTAGGAGLVIDYGEDGPSSNSFRAFRDHEIVNVFDDPGSADLTANVDFGYLKESLAGVATPHGPITQRDFLSALGLAPRLNKLLKAATTGDRKLDIAQAAKRLVEEDGMGGQYKFLGVTPTGVDKVYPFEPAPENP